jgi:hypothetical protein
MTRARTGLIIRFHSLAVEICQRDMMKQHQFDFLFQALDCNTNREGLHVLWTDSASWVRRSSVSGAADYFSDFTHRFAELFEAAMQYKLHWMIPPRETRGQRAAPRALRSLRTTFNHGGGVVPALFAWTQIYSGTLVGWPRAYCAPTPAAKQSCMVTKLPACKRVGAPLGFPSHTINQKIGAILSSLRALTGARIFMVNRM